MQKRRSHKKSRRGCLNCKKWHTKCDEQGPPCNNCTLRNAKCEYAWATKSNGPNGINPSAASRKYSSSSADEPHLNEPSGLAMRENRRLLELDLMHQWSTTTYTSLCSVPEDHNYMQFVMPREALSYDFLLNGIFVAAALHRSTTVAKGEARGYFNIAMELYDRASRSFRTHLRKMDPATHHLLYIFSSMAAFINIAFSQCNFSEGGELNTLSTVAVAFDLLNGSINIAQADFQRLLDSPVPVRAYFKYGLAPAVSLYHETRAAIYRLKSLNELYHHSSHYQAATPALSDHLSIASSPPSSDGSSTTAVPTPWNTAIALLHLCFAEEQRGVMRGFCFLFPGSAGPDFTAALKTSDPMALLILMHWTVLIERTSGEYWWAEKLGRRLAVGCWKAMQLSLRTSRSPALITPEWGESVAWVCAQLGLPRFVRA
ncbi:hypothetical protein GGR50DRAFT_419014 [Xylaria sp. CBS 124048]|nr:hypothetical protein GGR50DRAFT_419014 [Xylaria sp. CBS 124048]